MQIYSPAEDSEFLSEIVLEYLKNPEINKNISKVLDVGTGTGFQAEQCIKAGIKKTNILCADINPDAINFVKKKGFNAVESDLFSDIKGKFDLIIFNPPYLPENQFDKEKDTTGGKEGDETILEFVKNLRFHLSENGIAFILTSSLTPEKRFLSEVKKHDLNFKKIASKNIFFETLFVWKITN
ncbi:methyltransferase [Candidatus Pacearchaeota archaeon]|nr:methyltransferase [Candidatus Pacearchaeota archaeon]